MLRIEDVAQGKKTKSAMSAVFESDACERLMMFLNLNDVDERANLKRILMHATGGNLANRKIIELQRKQLLESLPIRQKYYTACIMVWEHPRMEILWNNEPKRKNTLAFRKAICEIVVDKKHVRPTTAKGFKESDGVFDKVGKVMGMVKGKMEKKKMDEGRENAKRGWG